MQIDFLITNCSLYARAYKEQFMLFACSSISRPTRRRRGGGAEAAAGDRGSGEARAVVEDADDYKFAPHM